MVCHCLLLILTNINLHANHWKRKHVNLYMILGKVAKGAADFLIFDPNLKLESLFSLPE